MHSRIRSDIRLEKKQLDALPRYQLYSSSHLRTELESTQPSQTYILQVPFIQKNQRSQSPQREYPKSRLKLQQSKSFAVVESDYDSDEHDIWDDEGLEQKNTNTIISFLELYKYRFERSSHKAISCYEILQMTRKIIMRHSSTRLRYFGIQKLQWIDFRDWSK